MASRRKKPTSDDAMPEQAPPRLPPSRVPANMSVFVESKIEIKPGPDDTYPWKVAGRFYFWPTIGMWRSIDSTRMGYGAAQLKRLIQDEGGDVATSERLNALSNEALAAVARAPA